MEFFLFLLNYMSLILVFLKSSIYQLLIALIIEEEITRAIFSTSPFKEIELNTILAIV